MPGQQNHIMQFHYAFAYQLNSYVKSLLRGDDYFTTHKSRQPVRAEKCVESKIMALNNIELECLVSSLPFFLILIKCISLVNLQNHPTHHQESYLLLFLQRKLLLHQDLQQVVAEAFLIPPNDHLHLSLQFVYHLLQE